MTTLQSKMGFQDDDLKTPAHDKIMMWTQEHAAQILFEGAGRYPEYMRPQGPAEIKVDEVKWEVPVRGSNGYTLGFIDMVIRGKWLRMRTEEEIKGNTYENYDPREPYWEGISVAVEVKTTIPNVGALLRQINLYNTRSFVVVSPDDRFADVLRSQGVAFYKYEESPEDEAMR